MKLSAVRFAYQVDVPGLGAVSELTSELRALTYDRANNTLWIGDDGTGVPWGQVRQHKRDRKKDVPQVKPQCDICLGRFNNAQALGAHRKHKHGIKGASHVAKSGGQ